MIPSMTSGKKALSTVLAVSAFLAGCGPTPSEVQLNVAQQYCAAGDQRACYDIPALANQAQYERAQQDTTAAVVGVVGAAAVIGAAAAASDDRGPRRSYGRRYYRR